MENKSPTQKLKNDFDMLRSENFATFKSTDFNSELDEKKESTMAIRGIKSKNSISGSSKMSTINSFPDIALDSHIMNPNKLKNTILLKNNHLTHLNYFIQNYVNDLQTIFNKIDAAIYKKVTSILDKHKYFLRFFKEISSLYESFSINLIHANNTINLHFRDIDSPFKTINSTIDKTQEIISNNFYDFSRNMQKIVISNGPLSNAKEFYNRMSAISKETSSILSVITKYRDKLVLKFQQYEKTFEKFKNSFNDNEKLNRLLDVHDFFMIEYDLSNSINKLFDKIGEYLKSYRNSLAQLRVLIKEFIVSIKVSLELYIEESKKMFHIQDIDNMLIEMYTDFDTNFEADFLTCDATNKSLTDLLKSFQTNLIAGGHIKHDDIYIDENFVFSKYNNYEDLVEFLHSLRPESMRINKSNLICFIFKVNKISGIFKSVKDCVLLLTVQNNLFIFEGKINKKSYEKFSLRNLSFRNSNDNKNPMRFEISELKKGMLYNSIHKILLEAENDEDYYNIEKFFL
jgi:hypothetical protein